MISRNSLTRGAWSLLLAALCLNSLASAAERRVLRGHVPAMAARAQAIGRLERSNQLSLAVGLPLRDKPGLQAFLRDIYDPLSPRFRHYLTCAEFTERFGPTAQDYRAVIDYLKSQGLKVSTTHPNRLVLDVKGPVAVIETAFQTTLRVYPHPSESRTFYAPDTEPSVPAGVPVLDVTGLDNSVLPHPMNLRKRPAGEHVISNTTGSGPGGDFMGKDFRAAYAPGVTLTGVGQVVGLFQFGPYFANDIPVYQQYAGLPTNIVVTNILLDGFTGIPAAGADDGEQALDIEMAMSMAPGATIAVYEGNSAYDILNRMATDNWAKQIGCSWGFLPAPSGMDNIFLEFAAQGQTLFDASGDGGAYNASSSIYAPTDDPYITCVGGTSLTTTGPTGPWASETTWGGSGGGFSSTYAIPTWQQGVSMNLNHGSTTQRNFPDVAMLADTVIFWVYKNGQTGTVGGTSAAAPAWAGFMALVNQQAVANGRPTIGSLNQSLYSLGQSAAYNLCFHDITTGNNFNSGSPANYAAVMGYDLCTGWGSPNGSNFINALAGPTDPLQISPGVGFTAVTPYAIPFGAEYVLFSLTNTSANPLNWSVGNTSVWLNVSSSSGSLPPGAAPATVTVSLNTGTVTGLSAGYYYANLWLTNLTSGLAQTRLFTLQVSAASWPLAVSGYNADVIVASTATPASPGASGFDIANDYGFYEAGLSGGGKGLTPTGNFTSMADNQTVFQLGPYGANNVLLMGYTYPTSRTLTLTSPQSYNSLAILASSANGGGLGTLVVNFTNGTHSQSFTYNDQDWFNTTANVAIQGFGRLQLSSWSFEDPGANNPNLYQTIINLAALGLNQPVASISFTNPSIGGNQDSGVFAVSGARMPPQVIITQPPQSLTNNVPAQAATLSVAAMGAPPLYWQWYYSASGNAGTYAPLSGQTGSAVSFNPAQTTNAGKYYVVITNAYNAVTSTVAALTVYRAPVIVQQPTPTNAIVFTGENLTFSVVAHAALPVFYFWSQSGTNLARATNAACVLTSLQTSNSGNYSVVVSNAFGVVTSTAATLSVIALPTSPYAQAVLANHPAGYWRLDEKSGTVAHDYIAANNGGYNYTLLGQPGDNLIDTHTSARFGYYSSSYGCVSNGGPIDFSTSGNAAFSVETWVNGAAQNNDNGLITKGTGGGGEQFNLDCGAGSHAFRFFVRDASGNAHLANSSVVLNSKWHHLVGVCDEANSNVVLYVDGVNAAAGSITPGSGILSTTNPVTFGSRQSGTTAYDLQFLGYMEEVAIYNTALSAAQVQAHYASATNRPPVFLANPFTVPGASAGLAYSATIATNASDPNGDTLTFAKVAGPAWLTVATTGLLSGTPANSNSGTNLFTVSVRDAQFTVTGTMSLYVNGTPTFPTSPIILPPATAGQAYSGSLAGSAFDPNNDPLTYLEVSGPAWLSISSGGILSGTPAMTDIGTNNFLVSATDPGGLSATATVNLPVLAPPPITVAILVQGTNVLLSWNGGNPPFEVQWTTNLAAPNWQDLADSLTTNTLSFTPSNDAAFYRVVGQ